MSILPVTIIVLIISLSWVKIDISNLFIFIISAIFLIIGMTLFQTGSEISMMKFGEEMGRFLTNKRKIWLIVFFAFLMGVSITISEPDLMVLAQQILKDNVFVIVFTVGVGVGIFLIIALLRIVFQFPLNRLFVICYIIVFVLGIFAPKDFLPMSFDSGGVTTGPMTVPFIMALGIGMASAKVSKGSSDDSFGLVGISSIGPIMVMMIFGIVYENMVGPLVLGESSISGLHIINSNKEFLNVINSNIFKYLKEVAIALSPIIILFVIMQFSYFKEEKKQFIAVLIGFLITYCGLVLFLAGANMGFLPISNNIGFNISNSNNRWALIPVGFIFGAVIVIAEPAVHVLMHQVEEVTSGSITKKMILISLTIGVGIAVMLSMIRIIYQFSIWWFLVPGYLIAIIMSLFNSKIFVAIAFDSGGVASGPMTAAFLLPLGLGVAKAIEGLNVYEYAFGLVAFVAMTPLITIQILGSIYKIKLKNAEKDKKIDEIIYFERRDE